MTLAAGAQNGPAIPDLDPADCSNGTFIADPDANPGLVVDCRALVSIRNHWTRRTLPTDSDLLTWGTGDTTPITAWTGIGINDHKVEHLDLSNNGLTGTIPPQLAQLTNLEALYLDVNRLTGTIPPQLAQLTNLEALELDGNRLTGTIPPQLGQLTNLWNLSLNGNELTGTIPPELGQLTSLWHLYLNGNRLTGTIPPQLGQLTSLWHLSLNGNRLTGTIPPQLGQLTILITLYLGGNELTGTIPSELGQQLTYQLTELLCPALFNGRFCDDDATAHEPRIETIAGWGITQGCDYWNPRYCPEDSITRRQMAAFLHRAVTHRAGTEPTSTEAPALNDVEEGFSLPYIQWAVTAGVMKAPEGKFNPDGIVTRADMAEMITAAFDHITLPAASQGIFADMTGQPDAVIRAAEALRSAGVTDGCSISPFELFGAGMRYCPDQPVTRAQMASFFARALS